MRRIFKSFNWNVAQKFVFLGCILMLSFKFLNLALRCQKSHNFQNVQERTES